MSVARHLIDNARNLRDWMQLPHPARQAGRRDRGEPGNDPGIDACVAATTDWLYRAQACSSSRDGGVARHFSVIDGWGPSYPETTGYIVPTMLAQGQRAKNDSYTESAVRMLDWLLAIQLPGGGFQGGTVTDLPVVPVTFNTGQILMGLAAGAAAYGESYTASMQKAAEWLVDCQDDDGSWRRNESPFALEGDKTYHTHTAWGLLQVASVSGSERFAEAALKNIHWAVDRMRPNGWFEHCCLTDPSRALTHTLGYALRGVIEGYRYSGDEALLEAAITSANGLLTTQRGDGALPGRIDGNLNGAVNWVCLTGNVQIAHCWLLLSEITGNRRFLEAGRAANQFVRRTVDVEGPDDTRGAIRGSYPISGEYGRFQYLNWAAKFFIDSNLLEKDLIEPVK